MDNNEDTIFRILRRRPILEVNAGLSNLYWVGGKYSYEKFYTYPEVIAYIEDNGWEYNEFKEVMIRNHGVHHESFY